MFFLNFFVMNFRHLATKKKGGGVCCVINLKGHI
jgi:hypothetical protein